MFDQMKPEAGVMSAYRARVAAGQLEYDASQAAAAERLQNLWAKLRGYDPNPQSSDGLFGRWLHHKPIDEMRNYPNGLYIVGPVGRSKSMLMDLFYDAADVSRKKRTHFHDFMLQAHARFHEIKLQHPEIDDPIPFLADRIAGEAALLCFDEFQIHDIVDAMILGRLFEALFARHVVVVATSNTVPDDLYKGMPGHDALLPFIELLKQHLDVLVLEAVHDYRRGRSHGLQFWVVPTDARADAEMDRTFSHLLEGREPVAETLQVQGRILKVPCAANGVARFDFQSLCGTPLGPGDYLAIASHYHTVLVDRVPALSPDNFDMARRFVTLIDTLYEHRVKLYASAAADPDGLYRSGEGAQIFERTASRLEEMQSDTYLALPHLT